MGAKKKPLDTKAPGDVGIEADRSARTARDPVLGDQPAAREGGGEIIEDEDTNETVEKIVAWLDERKLIWHERDPHYALHYEGEFNKNSLGAVSEAPSSPASSAARRTRRRRRGRPDRRPLRRRSASTARRRSSAPRAPRASRSRSSTRWPRSSRTTATTTPVRRRPARLRDRRRPGRAPERRRDDGGHRGQGRRTASSSPSARSCRTRRSSTSATDEPASSSAA
jgi:hypothetical protein